MNRFKKNLSYLMISLFVVSLSFQSCSDDDEPALTSKEIVSFMFVASDNSALTSDLSALIANRELTVNVPLETDVTSLVPTIEISEGATINPAGGVPQDFTNPVEYVVTAEDGSAFKYTVIVNVSANTLQYVMSFTVDGISGDINDVENAICAKVAYGVNINSLAPEFTLAEGATVSPESGAAQDFTYPVEYTVTKGGETKTYLVTIAGTPLKGEYDDSHDGFTFEKYWNDNSGIEGQWSANGVSINGTAWASMYTHEPRFDDNSLSRFISGWGEPGSDETLWPGRVWMRRDSVENKVDGNSLVWINSNTDKWGNTIRQKFELEKALLVNEEGIAFDITDASYRPEGQNKGIELPLLVYNTYNELYTLKSWYVEIDETTGVRTKSYREFKYTPYVEMQVPSYYWGDVEKIEETRECLKQEQALWNELEGWVYGSGDIDGNAPSGKNVVHGYTEYFAQGIGRGWKLDYHDNRTNKDFDVVICAVIRP